MAPAASDDRYGALLQRQLPQLSKRLRGTLDKLRTPEVATRELPVPASQWWNDLRGSLEGSGVTLEGDIATDCDVPAALFDSFVENALDNARAKAGREADVAITVRFSCGPHGATVQVRDTGSAVTPAIVRTLFREPVDRDGSLGIGLYHAARQAQQAGYRVELAENTAGAVCFVLTGAAASGG